MTTPSSLLVDAVGRVHEDLPGLLDGLDDETLRWRPDPAANPIGWLVWHLTRVQDDHLAQVGGVEQVWTSQGFADRFALPYDVGDIGYGQSSDQVGAFRASATDLLAYHAATHELSVRVLEQEQDLDRVVDDRWDPPVTAAVRLVSVVNDITQHLGQAAYVRGLLDRR
ncbi:mycothiol transferase [Nocardioides marmoribigeumensis]|uniref:DUF664 domain-containing protein n=1 Tax=Nocardioides marmoribigeumensis TaxID=433649 RepID=A0ABU2BVW1_9ACTN|nr:DUF664 domain-containing protein [Nocardioides marmoribigeumensis]MDR7362406.1 hypothetical protein [Nocardioides marmoribigeumensis]